MTTLAATLGALTAILQSHPLCERTAIVETREFSPGQFYRVPHACLTCVTKPELRFLLVISTNEFSKLCNKRCFKVRAELPHGYQFQTRVYSNFGHVDYAYQLFKEGSPLLRWDNKEEFRTLKTYPHHHHDDRGNIQPSPLTGDPQADIVFVLREIENFLADLA